jgi:hypothetical protein
MQLSDQTRSLRGKIIASLGVVYGTKFRMRCPQCGHSGIGCLNFLSGLAAWSCGKCDAFEPGFRISDEDLKQMELFEA